MEARDYVSAMGVAGELWLWRAAIYFLSTGFVDARSNLERGVPLDDRFSDLHLDCFGGGWSVNVPAGAKVAQLS